MFVALAWQLPLIAVGVGFHLAVSWALLWRYFHARERSLLIWGLAWLVLAFHVLGMYLTRMGLESAAPALRDISFAAAALALFLGQAEKMGRALGPVGPVAASSAVAIGLALVLGVAIDAPLSVVSAAVVAVALGGAAWLSRPVGQARRDITQWLLFTGYVTGALHGLTYTVPLTAHWSIPAEISSHVLFSLLFSAAVTWQAWEHERALRFFSHTLQRLNRPLSLQEAMDEALNIVAEALHATEGWILLREEGRGAADGEWIIGSAYGFPHWAKHGVQGTPFTIDRCLCLRPVDKEQLVTTIRDLPCVRASKEAGHPAGRHVTIPLGSGGTVQGIMSLMFPAGGIIDAGLVQLLNALGEQIGLAIDRVRLYDELKSKEEARGRILAQLITAQEDERRRIARELHDETGQALTALVVTLDFLLRHPVDEKTTKQRIASIRDMAESTLAEVRRVVHEMRPSVLDDLGLEAAVRWLVRRFEPGGLQVSLEFKGVGRLPGPLEITVFRFIQEACTNTIKHANADRLWVRVVSTGGRITVEVEDDGQGIDQARAGARAGMGLAGLKERVSLMGGTLAVRTASGEGTLLRAELPLEGVVGDEHPSPDLRRPHDDAAGGPYGSAVRARH